MKKIIGFLMCFVLIISMAACGNTKKDSSDMDTSNANTSTEKEPVEQIELNEEELSGSFTYWSAFSGDSMEWDKGRIAEFEAMYPNIKVDAQFVTDSAGINNGKLLAAIAGGNAPDLIIADSHSAAYAYAAQGSFESWEPYMETLELKIDDFITGYKDIISYEGTPYLIPQDGNALLLYYNPDDFEEVGLDPDTPPTTLEELDEYAELLTKKNANGTYDRFGFIPWLDSGSEAFTWPFFFGSDIYDTATKKLTLTDDNVVESFQWMAKYAEKYDPEKIQAFVSGAGGMFSPDHPFMKGTVSMTITGNWFSNALKIYAPDVNFRVAAIPVPEYGRKKSTTLGANVFAIPRGAKNADLAALFVKYCLRPEVNAANFDVWRSVPTIDASFDEVSWTIAGDEMYALERELINSPDSGLPALTSVSAQLDVDLKALRDDVLYNKKDPLPLLEELQERLQAEIDEK